LPEIPYSVWGPENLSPHAVEVNGQISLLSRLPIKNRLEITAKQLQNSSLTDEWYTPEDLVELGRLSLGGEIYTDPATSVAVNGKFIKAKLFYTRQTNGLDLTLPWRGSVWLNPPYGRGEGSAGQFILRLCSELRQGNVTNAVTCLNVASMSSKWFYTQIPQLVQAHCIVNGRPNFYPPTGQSAATSPTKGIVISYFGADAARFCEIWRSTGQILVPRQCL
jgi:hypothetical protein